MNNNIVKEIKAHAIKISGAANDFDQLIEHIDDAQIVMLGEATHGTREFYETRAHITQRLITEKGFNAIAIEGDWPDAYRVNSYIHGRAYDDALDSLGGFDRFPTWMWRNIPMIECIEWLKKYNEKKSGNDKVGFFGLDLYSLYRSMDIVIEYLEKIDPQTAQEARYHYGCFDQYRQDPQLYGYSVFAHKIKSCEFEVLEQLKRFQQKEWEYLAAGLITADESFYIEQNARVVKNAEYYFRSLFINEANNWNIRDSHMFETLTVLIQHYQSRGVAEPKIVIWAHNSHVGNAAATQMSHKGEYNIGELVKNHFQKKAVSIGFTTFNGTVSAASDWHGYVERKIVRDALPNSYEALFHALNILDFVLIFKNKKFMPSDLLERAIGVVYLPHTERMSHYFYAHIAEQFDMIIHYDTTTAIEPLEKNEHWIKGEPPETYPSGL